CTCRSAASPTAPTRPGRHPSAEPAHARDPEKKEHQMSRDTALVTADWVEEHLDDPSIVLVEVDEDTTSYDKGHIKNAIKLDWTTDLQDQVRRDFVNKEQFEALLSEKGIGTDHTVVLYGGNN